MRVVQGENLWRLVRTDRDAASVDDVAQSAGAAMAWFLKTAQPTNIGSRTETAFDLEPTSPHVKREWRIGAARPVQVLELARSIPNTPRLPDSVVLPRGKVLGGRFEEPGAELPFVVGERPWFVVVRFWWRAPSAEIPYPALRVDALGMRRRSPLDELDWYLDQAIEPAVKTKDPGAETFVDVVVDATVDALPRPKTVLLVTGAIGLGLAALFVVRKSRN